MSAAAASRGGGGGCGMSAAAASRAGGGGAMGDEAGHPSWFTEQTRTGALLVASRDACSLIAIPVLEFHDYCLLCGCLNYPTLIPLRRKSNLYLRSIEADSSDIGGSRAQGGSLELTEPKKFLTAECLLSKNTPIRGFPCTPIRPWLPNQNTGVRRSSGQLSQQAAR